MVADSNRATYVVAAKRMTYVAPATTPPSAYAPLASVVSERSTPPGPGIETVTPWSGAPVRSDVTTPTIEPVGCDGVCVLVVVSSTVCLPWLHAMTADATARAAP